MSGDGQNMNSILLELETAIKNSYMSEFETFILKDKQEVKENPLPSKILDCENEDLMIETLSNLDADFEIKNMLKIEEQIYSNLYEDREKVFSTLYYQSANRISFLVKVIQKLIQEKNHLASEENIQLSNKEDLINSFKDRIRHLNGRILSLQDDFSTIEIELEDRKEMYNKLSSKYEDLICELEMFKGDDRILKKLEFETLVKFEDNLHKSLTSIAKIKNEKINDYMADLKFLKQTVEDTKKCIICHEHQACILLKPCNHANVCEGCSLKLTNCPIDRVIITSQEKIYL